MNRHERRAAEAKIRRRGVGTPLDEIDKGAMMIGARSAMPDDIKADIARVVCAIWFPLIAGQACYIRSAIGYRVLTMLGFEPEGKIGGLLFRAGPIPVATSSPSAAKRTTARCTRGNSSAISGLASTARRSTSPAANGST